MTTIDETTEKCYVCEATHQYAEIVSTTIFGAPDLDTRPAEMERSTMEFWIRRCPSCGYCAPQVSTGTAQVRAVVTSGQYQQLAKDASYPELANRFRSWAMIQESIGDIVAAGWAYVHAAWACDDAGTTDAATTCRSEAIRLLRRSKAQGASFIEPAGAEEAILADLLRRSGRFDEAMEASRAGLGRASEEIVRNVLSYEIELAGQRDSECHSSSDALQDA